MLRFDFDSFTNRFCLSFVVKQLPDCTKQLCVWGGGGTWGGSVLGVDRGLEGRKGLILGKV